MAEGRHYFDNIELESTRWTDVILRSYYPAARTEIWQLLDGGFAIFVPRKDIDAKIKREWFDHSIARITSRITLTNERPEGAVRVPALSDHELGSSYSAMPLTSSDLLTLLAGRLPDLPPISPETLSNGAPNLRRFICEGRLNANLRAEALKVLRSALPGFDIELRSSEEVAHLKEPQQARGDVLQIRPLSRRASLPDFVRDEEVRWFADQNQLFSGDLEPEDIAVRRRGGATACFLPTAAGQGADLRQVLMAFDMAYLELPITGMGERTRVEDVLGIAPDDLAYLVEQGRVRIVTRQPEERLDLGLLRDLHAVQPHAVAGRRATATFVVADLIRTARESLMAHPDVRPLLPGFASVLADQSPHSAEEHLRRLLLPERVLRGQAGTFLSHGIFGIGAGGLGADVTEDLKRAQGKDYALEAYAFSDDVHMAHALGATLVPRHDDGLSQSWLPIARGMGETMNLHAGCTPEKIVAWAAAAAQRDRGERVLPPVPVFVFEDAARRDTSLRDVLAATERPSDRAMARALITRLADLPEAERTAEAERLAGEMVDRFGKRGRIGAIDVMGEAASAFGVPFVGPVLKHIIPRLAGVAHKGLAANRDLDQIVAVFENLPRRRNAELDLLAKVHRVARLQVGRDNT